MERRRGSPPPRGGNKPRPLCPTCGADQCPAWIMDGGFAIVVAREGDTLAGRVATKADVEALQSSYKRGTAMRSHIPGTAVGGVESTLVTSVGGKTILVAFCSVGAMDELPTSSDRRSGVDVHDLAGAGGGDGPTIRHGASLVEHVRADLDQEILGTPEPEPPADNTSGVRRSAPPDDADPPSTEPDGGAALKVA